MTGRSEKAETGWNPPAKANWSHWVQFAAPALILGFGGNVLVRNKSFVDQPAHPVMILFLLSMVASFVFSLWSGTRIARRSAPRQNERIAGAIVGIAGFFVSTVVGLILLLMFTRDMAIAE